MTNLGANSKSSLLANCLVSKNNVASDLPLFFAPNDGRLGPAGLDRVFMWSLDVWVMEGNSLDLSVASRVCLTALCWIAFATSKSRTFFVLIPEQSCLVWSFVLTGERGRMRLVLHILEVGGVEKEERRREERRGETRCHDVTPTLHTVFLAYTLQSQFAW